MKEVELKYLIDDKKPLMEHLKEGKYLKEKHEIDKYFDTKEGLLASRGIYIRIRNERSLDFKFNLGNEGHKHEFCDEINFSYPLEQSDLQKINDVLKILSLKEIPKASILEICRENNLVNLLTIDKHRTYIEKSNLTFCVDDVKGLGTFVEVERIAPDDEVEKAREDIKKEMSVFSYKVIPAGYIDQYMKRYLPEAYKNARYKIDDTVWV